MAVIGWYGPLIGLSDAPAHIGDYVQLVVFVHGLTPIQVSFSTSSTLSPSTCVFIELLSIACLKSESWCIDYASFQPEHIIYTVKCQVCYAQHKSTKDEVIRIDIQVGDDTKPYFSVSSWKNQIRSVPSAGDIVLFQNVKITRFRDIVEATMVQHSAIQCLIHSFESLVKKDVDELLSSCRVGIAAKSKLRKVMEWVQRSKSVPSTAQRHIHQDGRAQQNWVVHEEIKSEECSSICQVSNIKTSCKATFYASVGEIFLPTTHGHMDGRDEEMVFITRRLFVSDCSNLEAYLICTGCQLCGSPLESENGPASKHNEVPLYCFSAADHLHKAGFIYKPFMMYVWDGVENMKLLVKNKAAEILFAGIKAETIHSSRGISRNREQSQGTNFYLIWLILVKLLLQQGKNSPLKFEVKVDPDLDKDRGRYEMTAVSMPCPTIHKDFVEDL